ncbi:hypothetical protein [Haloferula sp.]|uniref:hypothetical protein n=1 Tax=Haloferula sp. TaxID=2497595 RepID=UPI00329B535D
MKEEPQDRERTTEETKPKRKGWNWGMIVVGVLVGFLALAAVSPCFVMGPRHHAADRTQAISNAKQIGLALLEFDQEFGSFPNDETAEMVRESTGTELDLSGTSSNAMFRQLIAYGIRSEDIFYCKHPEGIQKPDGDMSPGKALEAGEVGFSYFCGQKTEVEPGGYGRPLLGAPMKIGTETFWDEAYGEKAVILRLDNSVDAPLIRKSDGKVPVGNGKTLFDAGPGTVWGENSVPDIRHPEPGR